MIDEQRREGKEEIEVDLTNLTNSIEEVYHNVDDNKDQYFDDWKEQITEFEDFLMSTTQEDIDSVKELLTGNKFEPNQTDHMIPNMDNHNVTCISTYC